MKRLLFCLLLATAPLEAPAQPRQFNQGELDALLAPVALYPDALLFQVLAASTRPYDVGQAASWARSNPGLSGDAAVQAAQAWGWHASVTALTAFPDILIRMDENPQWLQDLSNAWMTQEPHVIETVHQLRLRAENVAVQRHEPRQVVYVRYYDPLVVYGNWWWASYRPVAWRPWHPRPHHHHVHHGQDNGHWQPKPVKPVHPVKPAHPRPAPINLPVRVQQVPRPAPIAAPAAQGLRQYRSISRYVKEADHAIRTNPVRASVPQRNRMAPTGARSP